MFQTKPGEKPSDFVVDKEHRFIIPVKMVKTIKDMQSWDKSEAYFEYMGFLLSINEAVKGKSNSQGGINASQQIQALAGLLNAYSLMVDDTPAILQPQRFGNQAFKIFYQKVQDQSNDMLQNILPQERYSAVPEIIVYLTESFGNPTRIDYGTGHEISFAMFLCCLFKIGYLVEADKVACGCVVFNQYLELARKLQKTYRMEPAGSHGVWSLDDYQFLPFIWGSSQLIGHPRIEPKSFPDEQVLNQYATEYMFLSCIKYISEVKSGPFAEHSNQLWSISGVPNWTKINGGLVKMYKVEVLGKFPVVQHIVFGSLLPLKPAESNKNLRKLKTGIMDPPSRSSIQEKTEDDVSTTTAFTNSNLNSPSTEACGTDGSI